MRTVVLLLLLPAMVSCFGVMTRGGLNVNVRRGFGDWSLFSTVKVRVVEERVGEGPYRTYGNPLFPVMKVAEGGAEKGAHVCGGVVGSSGVAGRDGAVRSSFLMQGLRDREIAKNEMDYKRGWENGMGRIAMAASVVIACKEVAGQSIVEQIQAMLQ